jgi:rRNA-processing protein FCF1
MRSSILKLEIHTTTAVSVRVIPRATTSPSRHIKQLKGYSVHNLTGARLHRNLQRKNYPKSLSEADKSVLHIANKINACVLSSDKTLTELCQKQGH